MLAGDGHDVLDSGYSHADIGQISSLCSNRLYRILMKTLQTLRGTAIAHTGDEGKVT